jgi:endonuclease YncB( thermonuclease family)
MVPRFGSFILMLAAACLPARAGESYGPVNASVARVIDGDTLEADARVWPGHTVRVAVRIRGIDAPEMRSRCLPEKEAAERARHALTELVADGIVIISNISGGKYYGRVVADVETADGRSVSAELLRLELVRSYAGGRRVPFCDTLEATTGSIP